MPTTTEPRVPHVIDVPVLTPVRRLPEGWLRGLVGGVEAAVLSWLTVVVPAVATYVATAAAPALGDADWQAAARTGTSLWLLAHGGTLAVGGGEVSLRPLGLTLLSLALVYGANRRMRLDSYGAGAFAVAGFVLATLVASATAGPGVQPWALLGGAALAAVGVGLGVRRTGAAVPVWWSRWRDRVPAWVDAGARAAVWALAGLGVLSAAAVAVGAVAGWDRVRLVHDAYVLDPLSMVVMTLAQLLYLPTALVWALAWVAGPGFAVGSGTLFAPGEVVAAPLPAVPLLGALPSPDAPGPQWVVVAPALVGVAVGVLLHRRSPRTFLTRSAGAALVCAVGTALVTALLVLAAAGSAGPGRMAVTGAQPAAVAGMVLAEVGAGVLLTVLALHPRTAELVGAGVRGVRERVGTAVEQRAARGRDGRDDDAARAASPDDEPRAEGRDDDSPRARQDDHEPRTRRDDHAPRPRPHEDDPAPATTDEPSPREGEAHTAGGSGVAKRAATPAVGTPAVGWHAVSTSADAPDEGGAADAPRRGGEETPGQGAADATGGKRSGRRGLGRWSGPSLSDWTRPGA